MVIPGRRCGSQPEIEAYPQIGSSARSPAPPRAGERPLCLLPMPRRPSPTRLRTPSTILTLILNLTVMVSVAVAAGARTATRTASSGSTRATITYRVSHSNPASLYSRMHLTITRAGRPVLDRPVRAVLCGSGCWPELIKGNPVLAVIDLEGGAGPDVVLNLYSGGAHCCSITQVYRYDPGTRTYAVVQHDFGDPGARIETLGGGPVFLSADDRFAYAFAAYAFSGLPVQIWRFAGGRFVDVTRRYPALIASDAARQWQAYLANRRQGFGLGAIAAWAADEYLLGMGAHARATLGAQAAAGELRSSDGFTPHGSTFVHHLERFLTAKGYGG